MRELVAGYDFTRFGTVVDVGGGHGGFSPPSFGLRRARTASCSICPTWSTARAACSGRRASSTAAGRRRKLLRSVPEGGDAYTLKSIIHDWDDDDAVRILRTCRAAMGPDARVLLVERDLGLRTRRPGAKLSDLNMLVVLGGRERTRDEYAALFQRSGLAFLGETPTSSGFSVFEAAPA